MSATNHPLSRKGRSNGRRSLLSATCTAITFLLASVPAHAFLARPVIFAPVGSITKAPAGWLQFCADNPDECRSNAADSRGVTLTPDLLGQLFEVNAYVNDRVKWTADQDLYRKTEHWAFPLDRGDCEDIVLLKRRLLAKAGWPVGSLLITTVADRSANSNNRHAVLTIHTDRGEMILDNHTPEILFWYETSYHYLSRQSPSDPNVWVSFRDDQPPATTTVAGKAH